jgi:DNA-binding NarL/FixJ family response regulator
MLVKILTADKDIEIVGESDSGLASILELTGTETDVVILEAALSGGMTPKDIVTQINLIRPNVKIVLCIDSTTKDMVVPFYDQGVTEFISKPYQRTKIKSVMSELKEELKEGLKDTGGTDA